MVGPSGDALGSLAHGTRGSAQGGAGKGVWHGWNAAYLGRAGTAPHVRVAARRAVAGVGDQHPGDGQRADGVAVRGRLRALPLRHDRGVVRPGGALRRSQPLRHLAWRRAQLLRRAVGQPGPPRHGHVRDPRARRGQLQRGSRVGRAQRQRAVPGYRDLPGGIGHRAGQARAGALRRGGEVQPRPRGDPDRRRRRPHRDRCGRHRVPLPAVRRGGVGPRTGGWRRGARGHGDRLAVAGPAGPRLHRDRRAADLHLPATGGDPSGDPGVR